jgi:predicted amidohydrolase YtcJ
MKRLISSAGVVTPNGRQGDALLIEDGQVIEIGDAAPMRQPGLAEIPYPDRLIVPGLHDHHFHPVGYTAAVSGLSVKDAADLIDLGERLRQASDGLPPGMALIAQRLDDETLAERRMPTRADLDRAVPERAVLVYRYCGHIAVGNTMALEMAGIGRNTPNPAGGSLDRDDRGYPTGVLRETAVELAGRALSALVPPVDAPSLLRALRGVTSLGLTGLTAIVSAGEPVWCGSGDEMRTLIEAAPDLPINLEVLVAAGSPQELEAAAQRLDQAGPKLRFLGWKSFADGSLGGHTAAMHQGFADLPGEKGILRLGQSASEMARVALGLGGCVAIHAIGDLANDRVLDLYELLIEEGAQPSGLRIEHASVLTETAIERMADLGVTASIQPAFLGSEVGWLEKRLGPDRLRTTYPFRSMVEAGIGLIGGSDTPVERPDPWWGMACAIDRGGLVSDQSLDASEAMALFAEPLQVGGPATFLVVSGDPVDPRSVSVQSTWIAGEEVPAGPELPFT